MASSDGSEVSKEILPSQPMAIVSFDENLTPNVKSGEENIDDLGLEQLIATLGELGINGPLDDLEIVLVGETYGDCFAEGDPKMREAVFHLIETADEPAISHHGVNVPVITI